MRLDPAEQQDGLKWLMGSGLIAICVALFLFSADEKLSRSTHEETLGQTLRELRLAQTTLPSRGIDWRLKGLQVKPHEGVSYAEAAGGGGQHSAHGGH